MCVVCAGVPVHTHIDGKTAFSTGYLSLIAPYLFVFLETGSLTEEAEPHQLARAGIKGAYCHAWLFKWAPGISTQGLPVVQQAFLPNEHLPASRFEVLNCWPVSQPLKKDWLSPFLWGKKKILVFLVYF